MAARRQNRSVFCIRTTKRLADLAIAHLDGRYPALIRTLCSVKVLMIDGEENEHAFRGNEFPTSGMTALDAARRRKRVELVDERHGRHAPIITSQRPTEAWREMIGDPTMRTPSLIGTFMPPIGSNLAATAFATRAATTRLEPTATVNPTARRPLRQRQLATT
jgi:hypothetical protein